MGDPLDLAQQLLAERGNGLDADARSRAATRAIMVLRQDAERYYRSLRVRR